MLMHYGRTHLAHAIDERFAAAAGDGMVVPLATAAHVHGELECKPKKPRLWWLRRGALTAVRLALMAAPF